MNRLWTRTRRSAPGASRTEGGRWRALAEATTDGFASPEHDDLHGRIAAALAAVFEAPALLLMGPGDDGVVVIRGASDEVAGA